MDTVLVVNLNGYFRNAVSRTTLRKICNHGLTMQNIPSFRSLKYIVWIPCFVIRCLVGHLRKKRSNKKAPRNKVLETSIINPRYHSNCSLSCRFMLQQALSLNAGRRKHLAAASALQLGSDGSYGIILSARTNRWLSVLLICRTVFVVAFIILATF